MSVFAVELLLKAVGLEQGVGRVLEAGDGVGGRGCRLQTTRTTHTQKNQNKNTQPLILNTH